LGEKRTSCQKSSGRAVHNISGCLYMGEQFWTSPSNSKVGGGKMERGKKTEKKKR